MPFAPLNSWQVDEIINMYPELGHEPIHAGLDENGNDVWIKNPGVRLSHSTINTLLSCPRKFELGHILSPRSMEDERNLTLSAGSAIHAAWQEYLRTRSEEIAFFTLLRFFDYEAESRAYGDAKNRHLEACIRAFDEIIEFYRLRPHLQLATINSRPAVELNFRFNLTCSPLNLWYGGFIDAILYDASSDEFVVHDVKTHRDAEIISLKYSNSMQLVGYGLLLNLLRTPSGEAVNFLGSFNTDYILNYIDLSAPRCELLRFTRGIEDLHAWKRQLLLAVRLIEDYAAAATAFPRYGKNCIAFAKPCWFAKPCSLQTLSQARNWLAPVSEKLALRQTASNLQEKENTDVEITLNFDDVDTTTHPAALGA